jgi:ferredoxin hydrogenase
MEDNKATRREFLKTATLGAGLLIGSEQIAHAQPWGSGRGQSQGQMQGQRGPLPILPSNPSIQHHRNRCRNCGRCREFCRTVTNVFGQYVQPGEDACIRCGQCTHFCTRAITEKYHYQAVAAAVADPSKIVVASTSPAIRVALGEMYRTPPGTNVEGKIVGAMKQLGVDHVLDVTFAADLTVMEEASELVKRLETGAKNLPMFTSCCPGWVRFAKLFFPVLLPNLSTTKSPVMMQGALVKTYFAQKMGIDPAKIVHVALTPCTAKKAEILLPGMSASGMRDVDIALTSREIAYLNEGKVDFLQAQEAPYSSLMGTGSGAGMIFGNTGGVMEAALRTAYKLLNGSNPPADFLNLRQVRGWDNVRTATVELGKRKLSVAVVHGIGRMRPLIEAIRTGTQKFDFVEVMACSGGCIGGGGQPIAARGEAERVKQQRLHALYQRDAGQAIRLSYDNPQIKAIYDEFLGKPLGEKAEKLLHVEKM